jgi:hypothetical protein
MSNRVININLLPIDNIPLYEITPQTLSDLPANYRIDINETIQNELEMIEISEKVDKAIVFCLLICMIIAIIILATFLIIKQK